MENTATPDTNTGMATSDAGISTGGPATTHNEAAPVSPAVETVLPTNTETSATVQETPVEPTVLGDVDVKPDQNAPQNESEKKDTEKSADSQEQNKEEGAQSEEPAQLPTYEAFQLPEDIKLEEGALGDFTKDLAELELLTKAPHEEIQKFGQKLVDRYIAEQQKLSDQVQQAYANAWQEQTNQWKSDFEKDPEIGGNRRDTTVNAAKEFIRTHGGTADQQKELYDILNKTGLGNHRAIIRAFANAKTNMREGEPLAATSAPSAPQSKVQKRYGGSL